MTNEEFWSRVDKRGPDECWPWVGWKSRDGYGRLWHKGQCKGAHVIAYVLAHGRGIFPTIKVLHTCDNPPCCNPAHLFLGTNIDNSRDCAAKGRLSVYVHPELMARGERVNTAKLTTDQVREIRRRYAVGGFTQKELAQEFNVTPAMICYIVHGKSWAHVKEATP